MNEQPVKVKLKPVFYKTKFSHHCGFALKWSRNGWRNPVYFNVLIGRTYYNFCLFNYKLEWPSDSKIGKLLNERSSPRTT